MLALYLPKFGTCPKFGNGRTLKGWNEKYTQTWAIRLSIVKISEGNNVMFLTATITNNIDFTIEACNHIGMS